MWGYPDWKVFIFLSHIFLSGLPKPVQDIAETYKTMTEWRWMILNRNCARLKRVFIFIGQY